MPRCDFPSCKKSVNVMAFKCKCGMTFCSKHRLPADHDCKYDFKAEHQRKLTEENPKVIPLKVALIGDG